MKTKEQLAEEYGKKWNKDEYNILAYDSFLAGYDAAKEDAEHWQRAHAILLEASNGKICKLEFAASGDNAVIAELNHKLDKANEKSCKLEVDRQAFKNCKEQLEFSRHRIETLELAKEYLMKKCEAANALIVELGTKIKYFNTAINDGAVIEPGDEMSAQWLIEHFVEALEKIKQYRENK